MLDPQHARERGAERRFVDKVGEALARVLGGRALRGDRGLDLLALGDARLGAELTELLLMAEQPARLGGLDGRPLAARVAPVVRAAEDRVDDREDEDRAERVDEQQVLEEERAVQLDVERAADVVEQRR